MQTPRQARAAATDLLEPDGRETRAADSARQDDAPPVPRWRVLGYAGAAVGSAITAFTLQGPGLADSFHYGEYFVAGVTLRHSSPAGTPLTIHGGVDYLPALLSRLVFGADHYLFPTWLGLAVLAFVAAVAGVEILALVQPAVRSSRALLVTGGFVAGATLGYRETALALAVLVFLAFRREERARPRTALALLGGLLLTLGLAWSWNRGLIGGAAVGIGYLLCLRHQRQALWAVVGAGVPALALAVSNDLFAPSVVVTNIRVLLQGGDIWRYAWTGPVVTLVGILALLVLAGAWSILTLVRSEDPRWRLPDAWLWSLLVVGLAKEALDRLDTLHLFPAAAVPLVLLAAAGSRAWVHRPAAAIGFTGFVIGTVLVVRSGDRVLLGLVLVCLVWTLCRTPRSVRSLPAVTRVALPVVVGVAALLAGSQLALQASEGSYDWVRYASGVPDTAKAVAPGPRWVAAQLRARHVGCILDLTNSGMINAAAELPTCTPYGYLVWVPADRQAELIHRVQRADPATVVWSTDGWMYAIDGKPMTERYPTLTAWVDQTYPVRDCRLGYCIASKSPTS